MIASLQNLVGSAQRRSRRAASRVAARRRYAASPYPIALYERFLVSVLERSAGGVAQFNAPPPRQWERGLVIVRHDVDTAACVEGLAALLDVDRSHHVPAATFLRTDGLDYDPLRAAAVVRRYRGIPGLTFGLHTSCYLHDDFMGAFGRETRKFEEVFGFRPDTFTVHGLGSVRADVRRQFVDTVRRDLGAAGFSFSDCHPDFRHYDYVVEDCHLDVESRTRFVYDDIVAAPGWIARGEVCLLLTHPCYWRASPAREDGDAVLAP
jgi:hypothetical protein